MLKSLFKKKQPPIVGLDIGTRCIKAVVLEGAEGDYMLTAFACEPIIKEAFREREITDFDAVSVALRKVRLALKNKIKPVAICGYLTYFFSSKIIDCIWSCSGLSVDFLSIIF